MFRELGFRTFPLLYNFPVRTQVQKCFLHLSGDDTASVVGRAGVGIAFRNRTEMALLDLIPVISRIYAARFSTSVKFKQNRSRNRTLFVISFYAATNSSEDAANDDFYDELNLLLNMRQSSDIVLVAGDFNAQLDELSTSKLGLGGHLTLGFKRTDNEDRLLHLCSTLGLFLANSNFRYKKIHRVTWRSANPEHPWIQLDHIVISRIWRGCIQSCRSYWSTLLDSVPTLALA